MANFLVKSILKRSDAAFRISQSSLLGQHNVTRRWNQVDKVKDTTKPIKFTTSGGYVNYKATDNFYEDRPDLPKSHNLVLASSLMSAVIYLLYLRDDIEGGGGKDLFKPLHESVPSLAIPILQAAIAENRRFGRDTKKLELELAERMKEPEKYGFKKSKLVEN